ncbi:MAG: TIM barrel protein [Bacteroidota bacterium]
MKKFIVVLWVGLLFAGPAFGQQKELDNLFYCFNNGITSLPNAPETLDAQAALIKKIGFDGLGGHMNDNYFKRRRSLDQAAVEMPEIYWGMDLTAEGKIVYKKELKKIIKDSKERDLMVALFLNGEEYKSNRTEGDRLFAAGIQELADFAAPRHVKIAIYPHVGFYCETSAQSVELARMVDRDNVGAIFNTCHLLKREGEEGWEEKALAALPYLYMVSINGADSGNTKEMGWERLIQPLGEGSFDTWKLVKLLKDNGYEGKFGLQCYGIKQDCEVALSRSMDTWNAYKERYRDAAADSKEEWLIHPKIPDPIPTTGDLRSMLTSQLLKRSLDYLDEVDMRRERAYQQGNWEAYGESVRQHVREAFGEMPFGKEGGPLNTRLVSTHETRHCRIENVLFESFPGWEVNATLFVPRGKGPFPAVVIPVGHSGKQYSNYQIPAQAFAKLGYMAVLFDPPGQSSEKQPGNDHFYDGVRTYLTGYSSQRYFVLDALRCIDYLETREDVDMSHGVGMTGVSGGGYTTLFATLFDERIACQGPSCCITSMADHPVGDAYAMCPESMWSGRIAAGVDEVDILLAGMPVPTIYMAGKKDEVFKIEWTRRMAQNVSSYFSEAGIVERFRLFEDESGHAYTLTQVEQFVAWMNRWLLGKPDLLVPHLNPGDFAMLDYEMIKCHPAPEENIFTLNRAIARDLQSRRDQEPGRDAVRQAVRNVIGTPQHTGKWTESEPFLLWVQNYHEVLFSTEQFEVPATLLRPADGYLSDKGKWIIYMGEEGRREALETWGPVTQLSQMLNRDADVVHHTFLIPDLPGWGDSRPALTPYSLVSWGSMDRLTAYISCTLGDGVLAMQARVAANLVQYLVREKNVDAGDIILAGEGLGGVVALLAGAAYQEEIGGIVSWSSLASFQSLTEEENYTWPSAAFMPDVLQYFDLPEVVRALEDCPVLILNPLDAGKHPLSPSEASSLFSQAGENVRIVPECQVVEALKRIEELISEPTN